MLCSLVFRLAIIAVHNRGPSSWWYHSPLCIRRVQHGICRPAFRVPHAGCSGFSKGLSKHLALGFTFPQRDFPRLLLQTPTPDVPLQIVPTALLNVTLGGALEYTPVATFTVNLNPATPRQAITLPASFTGLTQVRQRLSRHTALVTAPSDKPEVVELALPKGTLE